MRNFHYAVGLFGLAALMGCGGSGGGGTTGATPTPELPAEKGTALFQVDVPTGKVSVVPLETIATTSKASILSGNAVSFTTSTLLAEGGEVGRRVIKVQLKNNLNEPIGVDRPIRLQFGVFGPSTTYPTDIRSLATVSTLVRDPSTPGFLDGPVGSAKLTSPSAVAVGKDGAIYFNGTDNRIRRLSDGYVSTVAQNVPATGLAYLSDAVTGREYLVAACPTIHSIKLVPVASGSVTTWAGADNAAGNVNGAPTTARFNTPSGIGIDSGQNQVLVADTANGAIRAIPFSFVGGNLVAGSVSSRYSGLTSPTTVHVSENRSVAVAETGLDRVRVYNAGSSREAIFGGTSGNFNGDGNLASFFRPRGITSIGNTFYVADTGNAQVRRIKLKDGAAPLLAANWTVSVLAGSGNAFFQDGLGTTAAFGNVTDLTTDNQSRLVAADNGSNAVRQIVSEGSFDFGTPDGTGGGEAALVNLTGTADLNGLLRPYIDLDKTIQPGETVDAGEWQFSIPPGVSAFRFAVTVEAATPFYAGLEAVLNPTLGPGSPNVVAQFLNRPSGRPVFTGTLETVSFTSIDGSLVYDRAGNLYCSGYNNQSIRRISPTGQVTTVAGRENSFGIVDGSGAQARFFTPTELLVNNEGTEILVSDSQGEVIRRIALTSGSDPASAENWTVTTIAGAAGVAGDADGSGASARFGYPSGMAALNSDSVYVSESSGNRIRLLKYVGGNRALPASWVVESLCGSTSGTAGYVDGAGASARFNNPGKIALTKFGTLIVADGNNNRIRSVDTRTTQVTTLAGSGSTVYSDSAVPTSAGIPSPFYLAADDSGAVYFASSNRIRRILSGTVKTVAGGGNGSASTGDKVAFGGNITGLTLNRQGDLLFVAGDRLVRLTRKLGR